MVRRMRIATVAALAITSVLLCLATLVARSWPIAGIPSLILAVGSPYAILIALCGVVFAVSLRQRALSVAAVAVLMSTAAVQVSWYCIGRAPEPRPHTDIRLLSSNLRKGQADASFFVHLAQAKADVITVSELTPDAVARFVHAGLKRYFPYSHLMPGPDAGGVGIWSRFPLTVLSSPRHRGVAIPAVRLHIPGLRFEPVVASVHVTSPVADGADTVSEWRQGISGAKAQLTNFAATAGPGAVIVGGDYNSTPDMRQFRDLLANGYSDAVEQLGAGFAPTFPSDTVYPPVITIDHVLARNAAPSSVSTVDIPGSDHRSLLATIQVPLNPGG